jgi:hypothetical protein
VGRYGRVVVCEGRGKKLRLEIRGASKVEG